ncbi:MAG: hypothetical protein ACRDKG_07450 [Actinomycetota bacterium]
MKRIVAFAAVLTVVLVLIATPGFAISGVTGAATTDNTIVGVAVDNTSVRLGIDLADVLNASSVKSTSSLIVGKAANLTIPGGQSRTATTSSESGKENIAPGTTPFAPLGSVTVAGGFIHSAVSHSRISSIVDFAAGAADVLNGLVGVSAMDSSTKASVGTASSTVERLLTIGDVNVGNLGALLDNLGINPLALACDAVEDAGAALGLGSVVADACNQLSAVDTDITGGLTELGGTETVLGTVETLLGPICLLLPGGTCDAVLGQIDALQLDIDDIQADAPDICATVLEALDDVSGQLDGILASLGVIDLLPLGDVDALIASVTGALGDVDSASSTLQGACDTLLGAIDGLLDGSILSLDGVQVAMDLVADKTPTSAVTGTIGALKVGTVTIADADDLVALGAQLQAAIQSVEDQLGTVFGALGLSGLPLPELDLMKVTSAKGKKSDGTYFATGSMRALHLGIPSAVVDVPAALPLDVLSGFGGFGIASFKAAAVTTPAVSVDAGVFTGEAEFKAASASGSDDGGTLPNTGLAGGGLAIAGLVSLAGARIIRRITNVI